MDRWILGGWRRQNLDRILIEIQLESIEITIASGGATGAAIAIISSRDCDRFGHDCDRFQL